MSAEPSPNKPADTTMDSPAASTRTLLCKSVFSKDAYIEVTREDVRLVLPRFWSQAVIFPKSNVVVVDRARLANLDDRRDGWGFEDRVVIPYVPTGATQMRSNLTLFFTNTHPAPQVTRTSAGLLPISPGLSRRGRFCFDGISLRAKDPKAAADSLIAAGVTSTDRPNTWLREHHRITHDPAKLRKANSAPEAMDEESVHRRGHHDQRRAHHRRKAALPDISRCCRSPDSLDGFNLRRSLGDPQAPSPRRPPVLLGWAWPAIRHNVLIGPIRGNRRDAWESQSGLGSPPARVPHTVIDSLRSVAT